MKKHSVAHLGKAALVSLCALSMAALAQAQTLAFVGVHLVGGAQDSALENATVIVRDGRIAAVGQNLAVPKEATRIDGQGLWLSPGIVPAYSQLGLAEVDAVDRAEIGGEYGHDSKALFSAALDVSTTVNARSVNIAINRLDGVTRAIVGPSAAAATIFAGQGAAITLAAGAEPLQRRQLFQLISLDSMGADIAGGPRAAAFLQFRNGLREAMTATDLQARANRQSLFNPADLLALRKLVSGETLALVHVQRANDIMRVLELRKDFPKLRLVLMGVNEGWLVADKLAAAKVPVILNAMDNLPESFDALASTSSNAGRLVQAGVPVALAMYNDNDARMLRSLPQHAGNLVALTRLPGAVGLREAQALATITRVPAEIFGLDSGVVAVGKRADLLLWDGNPLELTSAVRGVWIDGVAQPMVSRQTLLRDRYHPGQTGDLPPAYRR